MITNTNTRNPSFKRKLISVFLMFMVIITTGCSTKYPEPDDLVVTIDNSKIYMNEMMYHLMLEKLQGNLYASFLGDEGADYWEIKADNGKTMREVAKDQAMENAIKYELFYQLAIEDGYSLTEEEKSGSMEKVDNILKNIPSEQLEEYGLTKEILIGTQDKITAATIYYNAYVDSLVNKEAVAGGINKEAYEQYDIEYIYGNLNQKDRIEELLHTIGVEDNFAELVKNTSLNAGTLTFLKGTDIFGEEENLEEIITAMEAGSVSDLIETVKGYYIIKLKDNTSTSEYDKAVEEAIDTALSQVFDQSYENLKNGHKIKVNDSVWDQVIIEN